MVFAFFNSKGLIYQHYAPCGAEIIMAYLIEVLSKFLKLLRQKRCDLHTKGCILHWDNSPLRTTTATAAFQKEKGMPHPAYSPDLALTVSHSKGVAGRHHQWRQHHQS